MRTTFTEVIVKLGKLIFFSCVVYSLFMGLRKRQRSPEHPYHPKSKMSEETSAGETELVLASIFKLFLQTIKAVVPENLLCL